MKKVASLLVVFTFLLAAAVAGAAEMKMAPAEAAVPAAAPAVKAKPAPPPGPTYATYNCPEVKLGSSMPAMPLKTLQGEEKDLNSLAKPGVAMVVFFTNSTCAACRAEAALLASMKADLKDKFLLVGVLTDISDKGYSSLDKEVQESTTFFHDPKFKVPPAFGFEYTPALIIVKDGKLKASKGGFNPAHDSQAVVDLVMNNI